MYRVFGFILLCGTLCNGFPFPFPATPTVAPGAPVPTQFPFGQTPLPLGPTGLPLGPTPLPLGPASRPVGPGFNNPYYNYAGAPGAAVPIVSYSSEHGLDGNYAFSFATADGKQAQETGYLKDAFVDNEGNPQGTQVVQGSYAYVSPDGTPIQVSYVADENGFRPSGVHIPADGKAVIPSLDKDKQIFDPNFNRYNDPFLNRNRFLGQYNNGRPYDPRYNNGRPYDPRYNNGRNYDPRYPYNPSRINPYYNNYNPYQISPQIAAKEEAKKEIA